MAWASPNIFTATFSTPSFGSPISTATQIYKGLVPAWNGTAGSTQYLTNTGWQSFPFLAYGSVSSYQSGLVPSGVPFNTTDFLRRDGAWHQPSITELSDVQNFSSHGDVLALTNTGTEWKTFNISDLGDTPNNYGSAGEVLSVNPTGNGVIWSASTGGGGGGGAMTQQGTYQNPVNQMSAGSVPNTSQPTTTTFSRMKTSKVRTSISDRIL